MSRLAKDYLVITLTFLLASLPLWGWFWFSRPEKLQFVYQNWDGPNYVIIAQSFYNPEIIAKVNYIRWLTPEYFASHFPLYPLFIRLFAFIGYFRSMIFVSWLFSLFTLLVFYRLAKDFKFTRQPLLLTLAFVFLPPRWFIVSHVGSSEPVFIFFLLLMFYFFLARKYWLSGWSGFLAALARPPAVFFFGAVELYLLGNFLLKGRKNFWLYFKKAVIFLLIPAGTLLVFGLYQIQYHDFLVFFKTMSGWEYISWPPFRGFSYPKFGLPTFWLGEKVYIYLMMAAAIFKLFWDRRFFLAACGLIYLLPLLCMVHMDLGRYSLPLAPLVFLAFEKPLTQKYFWLGLILILPAIYAYSATFMSWNLSP